MPLKVMVCGDPLALSTNWTFAELGPTPLGVKVTETEQLLAAGRGLAQKLSLMAKSPALAPAIEI
jgi:hypothetical protein